MAAAPDDTPTPAPRPPGQDRRRKRRFVLVERRSGFDRRRSVGRSSLATALEAPVLRLRDRPVVLAEVLLIINLLSVLDLLLTLWVLRMGAIELNPVMAWLIESGTAPAAAGKIGIMLAATLGLWLLRRYRLALTTTLVLVAVYCSLIAFELIGLIRLA